MTTGQKIRKIRQLRDMKQDDLADRLGIDKSIISKMENDNHGISTAMLEQLAEVLEIIWKKYLDSRPRM